MFVLAVDAPGSRILRVLAWLAAVVAVLVFVVKPSWWNIASLCFVIGVFLLVPSVVLLRNEEEGGRALVLAASATALVAGAAIAAVYTGHSWWALVSGGAFLEWVVVEILGQIFGDAVDDENETGEGEIGRDIAEKQARQDEQLPKVYPHL